MVVLRVGKSLNVVLFSSEPRFPKDYPTGCLLGCVNVTDCLSQEQFRQQVSEILHCVRISYIKPHSCHRNYCDALLSNIMILVFPVFGTEIVYFAYICRNSDYYS